MIYLICVRKNNVFEMTKGYRNCLTPEEMCNNPERKEGEVVVMLNNEDIKDIVGMTEN